MGKKSKKDHKKKSKKSHKSRSRSSDSSSSSDASTKSKSPDSRRMPAPSTSVGGSGSKDFFPKAESNTSYYLSQKSEMLLFDKVAEVEDQSENFVWRKKDKQIGIDKLEPAKVLMINRLKQEETARELDKLKKRKVEREREREERDRERDFLQRQKETEYHAEWEKQEDSFHLKQVKLRSKIRIEEGRAKPIDLLAKYINAEEDDLAIEMHEPYTYLNGLTIRDLEDLLVDIKVYSDLELGVNAGYWKDITIVTEDELKKLQKMDKDSKEHAGDRREGMNQAVLQDVSSLFRGKTSEQLVELEQSIKAKIKNELGIDIGYWESLLAQLKAHMARARLRDKHKEILYQKLNSMKKQQGIVIEDSEENAFDRRIKERIQKEEELYETKQRERAARGEVSEEDSDNEMQDAFEQAANEQEDKETTELEMKALAISDYQAGNYSPVLLIQDDLPVDTFILTQKEDNKRMYVRRSQVLGAGAIKPDEEEEFEKKAREKIAIGEEELSEEEDETKKAAKSKEGKEASTQEVQLDVQSYSWSDKYRPRKPRYYNRVHTGYDWNQYNKKHYDIDNPPPKTVQGYKLNIFYPDLIDKTKTPVYSITRCKDAPDFSILRFHAGPPYEDVAFKIVSKEWDISHRHGFRNQFQNGIYQLWFHFRKWKYRR